MISVNVKWGKECLKLDVNLERSVMDFKQQLQSLTNVPVDKQKVMGVKGGILKDDADMRNAGITSSKPLMLIGTAEEIAPPPEKEVVFSEDIAGGGYQYSAISNGLTNLANTCYLNSAVQALRYIPQFRRTIEVGTSPLEMTLVSLYNELDGTKESVPPFAFWRTFITQYPSFAQMENGHPMQHDSQEALNNLLTVANQTISKEEHLRNKYRHLFCGETTQKKVCLEDPCIEATQTTNTFTILPCNIVGEAQTLEAALEQSLSETISGNSPSGASVTFKASAHFSKLPEFLCIQFVRFSWRRDTNSKAKILKPITFPMVLDLNYLCTDELKETMKEERAALKTRRDETLANRRRKQHKSSDSKSESAPEESGQEPSELGNTNAYYELFAVISHKGRDADSGHYVAWVKKGENWLVFDDTNVAIVSEEDVQRLRGVAEAHIAYVLIYRSRNPDNNLPPIYL
eukprot:Tbor_TRINITY_DN3632_c0_g1::TRINITY_DN3632_c0_g1_i1::g.219::m.219/K11843/USP14, UBP6; ubiquitin carboxyl-terminal hydrolase 14